MVAPSNDKVVGGIPPVIWFIAAMVYVVCPLDMDFIPVIGWIDDVVVAYIGISKWRQGVRAQKEAEACEKAQTSQSPVQEVELFPPLLMSEVRPRSNTEAGGR